MFQGKGDLGVLEELGRMANKYRLSTAAKIDSVVEYCSPDMKNSVNALMSMAKREVRDETQETREESQWIGFKKRALNNTEAPIPRRYP